MAIPVPSRTTISAGCAILAAIAGCASQPEGSGEILDPTKSRADMGTLIDISDILEISAKMVGSLRQSPEVDELLRERRPLLIAIETREIKNLTTMTSFSKLHRRASVCARRS